MNEIKSYLFITCAAINFFENHFYPLGYYGSQLLSYPLTRQYNNANSKKALSQKFSVGYHDPFTSYGWSSEPQASVFLVSPAVNANSEYSSQTREDQYHKQFRSYDDNVLNGQHSFTIPDGRFQKVEYTANPSYGYIPNIPYNDAMKLDQIDAHKDQMHKGNQKCAI